MTYEPTSDLERQFSILFDQSKPMLSSDMIGMIEDDLRLDGVLLASEGLLRALDDAEGDSVEELAEDLSRFVAGLRANIG